MSLTLILASLADDIGAFLAEETRPNVLRELPDSVTAEELEAETKSWILEYLTSKSCPSLIQCILANESYQHAFSDAADLSRFIFRPVNKQELEEIYEDQPLYDTALLMPHVFRTLLERLDAWRLSPGTAGQRLDALPYRPHEHRLVLCAIKNTRRRMEDRHLVVHDLNALFGLQMAQPQSLYAIFDGHAGSEAATFGCAHMAHALVSEPRFASEPELALKEAVLAIDAGFVQRALRENMKSGSTVLAALVRGSRLWLAWAGDSQALLVRNGQPVTLMRPHKPDSSDERRRIEQAGGCVLFLGGWRVNGALTVSRSIGDADYKPAVTAEPEVSGFDLLPNYDDFLVLACDGLWDTLNEETVTRQIYAHLTAPNGYTRSGNGNNGSLYGRPVSAIATGSNSFGSTTSSPAVVLRGGRVPAASGFVSGPSLSGNSEDAFSHLAERLVFLARDKGSQDNITCMVIMLRNQDDIVRDYLAETERARLAAEGALSEECSSPILEPPALASHPRLSQKRGSLTTGLLSHIGSGNNISSLQGATVKQTSPHRNSFCGSRTRLPNKPQLTAAGVVHSPAAASGPSGAGAAGFTWLNSSSTSASTTTSASVPYQRGRSSSQPQDVMEQTISKMSKMSVVRRSVSTKSGGNSHPASSSKAPASSGAAAKASSSKSSKLTKSSAERKLSQ